MNENQFFKDNETRKALAQIHKNAEKRQEIWAARKIEDNLDELERMETECPSCGSDRLHCQNCDIGPAFPPTWLGRMALLCLVLAALSVLFSCLA